MANEFNPDVYLAGAQAFNPDEYLMGKQAASSISANNPDVPGMTGEPVISDAAPRNDTLGDVLQGAAETALTLGTGATTGAAGFAIGSAQDIANKLISGEDTKKREEYAQSGTYAPKTEAGQEMVGDIGESLSSLPPVGLTGGITPKIGAPNFKLPKSRNKAVSAIADLGGDNVKKSFTKKLDGERFTPRIFNMVKAARKQGFDDSVTTLIANSSPTTKRRMMQQIGVVERGKGDARLKALERTADIAGDSLVKKINFVKGNNKQAGQQLNRVSRTLKGKEIDINEPVNKFLNDLDELGVTLDEKGKPIFSGSRIEGVTPAESLITKVVNRIERKPTPDALEAHQFKEFIDENISFGKSAAEGLSGKTESVVKSLRKGVNESINEISIPYRDANKVFSDTITALDDLQDVAGRKLDFSGPNADKAAGVLLRSQTNNTKGRANLLTAISNLEDTAKKYGGSFDDDILNLSIFSDELDAVFGSGARTSLRGEVGKAGVDAAIDLSQMTIPGAVAVGAKAGAKRLRGINEKNQLKAIKDLLKAQ